MSSSSAARFLPPAYTWQTFDPAICTAQLVAAGCMRLPTQAGQYARLAFGGERIAIMDSGSIIIIGTPSAQVHALLECAAPGTLIQTGGVHG